MIIHLLIPLCRQAHNTCRPKAPPFDSALLRLGTFGICFGVLLFCRSLVVAQTDATTDCGRGQTEKYAESIASFVNRNEALRLVGDSDSRTALFDDNYDWKEDARIELAIDSVVANCADALPVLVENLDNEKHSMTLEMLENTYNVDVGGICYYILEDAFNAAYFPLLPKDSVLSGEAFFVMRRHPVMLSNDFKKWCQERLDKKKQLYEFQIEMCEWAIEELPGLEDCTEEQKVDSAKKIRAQIELLRKTKIAARSRAFFRKGERVPVDKELAELSN